MMYSFSNSSIKSRSKEKQRKKGEKSWLPTFLIRIYLMGRGIIEMTIAVDHSGPIISFN